jgi:pimeloyl-ACP methyl ester carboxylesterase
VAVNDDLLNVPGARLYYETRGSGPVLLLIVGGNGDASTYQRAADLLADRYTVITYERRGFSRSPLDGPVPEQRLATDGDDAHRLLSHVTDQPAHVFGSSSGAIVSLDLATRYPNQIRTVIAHEPPLANLLPDADRWLALMDKVYDAYRESGVDAAMRTFTDAMGVVPPMANPDGRIPPPEVAEMIARIKRNMVFWLENEARQYPRYIPDVAALKAMSDRIVLAGGLDSQDHFPYRPNTALAEQLGLPIAMFAGGHIGYATHPAEFAARLHDVLSSH